jgi:hypothetical protein
MSGSGDGLRVFDRSSIEARWSVVSTAPVAQLLRGANGTDVGQTLMTAALCLAIDIAFHLRSVTGWLGAGGMTEHQLPTQSSAGRRATQELQCRRVSDAA